VIPKSFGKFKSNLTLINVVCKSCNDYFSRELELMLGRDSFEGMLRYKHGIKEHGEFRQVHSDRLTLKIECDENWKGAIVEFKPTEAHPEGEVNPVPQVGFRKKDSEEWEFFQAGKLKTKTELERLGFITSGIKSIKILCPSTLDEDNIRLELEKNGINLNSEEDEALHFDLSGKESQVSIEGIVDKLTHRVMAKIAFNYLACQEGSIFALCNDFNEIRDFIRHGKETKYSSVVVDSKPILYYEQRLDAKETHGHILTLNWDPNDVSPYSSVTLFNRLVYKITFCKRFLGLYRKIRIGHHFNTDSKAVTQLLNPYLGIKY